MILCAWMLLGFYYFVPKVQNHEKRETVQTLRKTAQQLATSFEHHFQQQIAEIEALAKLPGIVSLEENNLDRILSEANHLTQHYNYFFVIDSKGKWLSYPSKPYLKGKIIDASASTWIQEVVKYNKTIFLDVRSAKSIKSLVSGFVSPIRSKSGEVVALVRGVITISNDNPLLNWTKKINIGETGFAYLVDSNGYLLAHPYISIDYQNFGEHNYTSFDPVNKALNGESGAAEYEYQQNDWVVAYKPLSSTGWALIVQQKLADIMQDAKKEVHVFSIFFVLSFLLFSGVIVSYFFYSLNPIMKLLEKIRSEEPFKIDSFPRDEIGILAHEFNKYGEKLEEKVLLRTKELLNANDDLISTVQQLERSEEEKETLQDQMLQAQKLESIGVLAGGIAHDFNNLLTGIMGYADLALVKMTVDSPVRQDIEKQRKICIKAAELAQQLLAFSRKQVVVLEVINLNSLVGSLLDMASRMIGETITLEVKRGPGLKNINADKTRIEQVLMNLIVNARDAMPEGGKLLIETNNIKLDDEYAKRHAEIKEGQYVMISVTDTGYGMTNEVKEKIFDPFFTTKEVGKGTGLGMATVYGIVKQHKGHIWVYSEPEQGTSFKIYLPAVNDALPKIDDHQNNFDHKGTEKIFIVDDNDVVREFIGESLKYHGYQVTVESSPRKALEKLEQPGERYDLLLTDVVMPEMNGRELAQAVREKIPSIKVIFMSGYQEKIVSLDEIRKDPAMEFIAKPIVTKDLTKKIRMLLD